MLYLAACFAEACKETPQAPVDVLYAQFLLWPDPARTPLPTDEAAEMTS
jgi:hypothetical protein